MVEENKSHPCLRRNQTLHVGRMWGGVRIWHRTGHICCTFLEIVNQMYSMDHSPGWRSFVLAVIILAQVFIAVLLCIGKYSRKRARLSHGTDQGGFGP